MKKECKSNILFSYIKEKLKIITAFILFTLIFFIIYALYNVSLEPVLYSILLTMTLGFIFSVYDFYKYYNKHINLKYLLEGIQGKLDDMPQARNLIEEDYQNIIKILYKNKIELEYKASNNHSEMINYYTMWVHQIKTPISALNMLFQSMDSMDSKQCEKLMNEQLFKIEQYVEMVLHYLRLENMSCDLRLEEYDLKKILNCAIKKHAVLFISKKITLDLEDINCKVITDKKWVTFVLEQIISNSLKYTSEGKISIYMDKQNKDTLVIKDTGIGIKEEDINRVFERGFTGYNGRMNKKSTGIGLYLCKEILKNLSNKIFIKSEVGKGTEVYIDFSRENIEIE